MERRTFNKLLGAGALTAALGPKLLVGEAMAAGPLKIGFIYVGPVGDFGWSYQHDQGRKAIEAKFGAKVKTSYVESVNEGPDATRVLGELAAKGNELIFATSFGFMNSCVQVAKRYPKVKFEHCTGYKRSANLATYNIRFYEARYIQGVAAGKLSKTGVAGYVASVPIPEVVMGMNAFLLGMRSVNPKARLKFIMINNWYDPGKEGDAAKALIDQGCDIITQHTDSPAPLQVAESRGIKTFGEATDMIKFAPHTEVTAEIDDWAVYYLKRVADVLDGKWKSTDTWGGFASNMLKMAPMRNVPADVAAYLENAIASVKSGKTLPFAGPLVDQSGKTRVAAGSAMDDASIASMDWLVEGVEGKLPA